MIKRRKNSPSDPPQQRSVSRFVWWILACNALIVLVAIVVPQTTGDRTSEMREAPVDHRQPSEVRSVATPASATHPRHRQDSQEDSEGFRLRFATQLQWLRERLESIEREDQILAVLDSLSPDEIPLALNFLEQTELTPATQELSAFLVRRWAGYDPQAAASYVAQLPAGEIRQAALDHAAVGWANRDPTGAAEWAAQLTSAEERERALLAVGHERLRTEPTEAIRMASDLPPDPQRDHMICRAVAEWATLDSPAAIAWAGALPPGALRESALAESLTAWASRDPLSAAALAVGELHSTLVQADAIGIIVQHWARQDPPAAAEWVAQFPPGDLRSTAITSVAGIWSQKDPEKAESWRQMVKGGALN